MRKNAKYHSQDTILLRFELITHQIQVRNVPVSANLFARVHTIVRPVNQGGYIIPCVGNLADEKL
jgi:hypothetical protein